MPAPVRTTNFFFAIFKCKTAKPSVQKRMAPATVMKIQRD